MLSLLKRMIKDLGGTYLLTDTDSMLFVASKEGGLVPCPGGPHRLADGTPAIAVRFLGVMNGKHRSQPDAERSEPLGRAEPKRRDGSVPPLGMSFSPKPNCQRKRPKAPGGRRCDRQARQKLPPPASGTPQDPRRRWTAQRSLMGGWRAYRVFEVAFSAFLKLLSSASGMARRPLIDLMSMRKNTGSIAGSPVCSRLCASGFCHQSA
jgi:hypothetical protein